MHNKYFKMKSFMQLKIAEGTSAEYLQATGFTEFYGNSKEKMQYSIHTYYYNTFNMGLII